MYRKTLGFWGIVCGHFLAMYRVRSSVWWRSVTSPTMTNYGAECLLVEHRSLGTYVRTAGSLPADRTPWIGNLQIVSVGGLLAIIAGLSNTMVKDAPQHPRCLQQRMCGTSVSRMRPEGLTAEVVTESQLGSGHAGCRAGVGGCARSPPSGEDHVL